MLRAVTFDLWSTLIMESQPGSTWTRVERIRRIEQVLCAAQINIGADALAQAYKAVGARLEELWKTHRDIDVRGQIEILLDASGIVERVPCSGSLMDRLFEAYTQPILSELPIPVDGAADVLSELRSRGLRLSVICNTGRTPGKILRIILERLDLLKHLAAQTFSDELGLRKPRAELFERTLAALAVAPQEALHVGDTLATDIAGARAIGMRAVHFCHARGVDKIPAEGDTISSLPELLPLILEATNPRHFEA